MVGNFKIEVLDVYYKVLKITPSPEVLIGLENRLALGPVQYSYDKIRTQTFSLPTGSSFLLEENLFAQELPSKIIVFHVPTESYSGSYKRNPFNVPHCDVSSIALYIDGL